MILRFNGANQPLEPLFVGIIRWSILNFIPATRSTPNHAQGFLARLDSMTKLSKSENESFSLQTLTNCTSHKHEHTSKNMICWWYTQKMAELQNPETETRCVWKSFPGSCHSRVVLTHPNWSHAYIIICRSEIGCLLLSNTCGMGRYPPTHTHRHTDRQTDRQPASQADRQTDRQTASQPASQAARQTDRQTDARTHTHTLTHSHTHTYTYTKQRPDKAQEEDFAIWSTFPMYERYRYIVIIYVGLKTRHTMLNGYC